MIIKREIRRCIILFPFLFVLLISFCGCNLFISIIDSITDNPDNPDTPDQPFPPLVITGLEEVGTINTGDAAVVIENGNYLYTAGWNGCTDNFCIIDFSDPSNPDIMGRTSVGETWGITTNGNYAYVETDGAGGTPYTGDVLAIDCTEPLNPVIVDNESLGYNLAYPIYYDNGYLYNCSSTLVSIYDISNPTDMIYMTEIPCLDAEWAAITENYLLFTEYVIPGTLHIYDITDPFTPVSISDVTFPYDYSSGIAVKGNYAFLAFDNGSHTISAVDISTPNSPFEASSISLDSGTSYNLCEVKIRDNYLFINGSHDLYVVDITDPYNMVEITSISTSSTGSGWGFALNGEYAIVADDTLYRVIRIKEGVAEPTPEPGPEPDHCLINWNFDNPGYVDYGGVYYPGDPIYDVVPGWELSTGPLDGVYNIGINTGYDPEAESNYLYLGQENTSNSLPVMMGASQDINYEVTASSKFRIRFKIFLYDTASGSNHTGLEYPVRMSAYITNGNYVFYMRSHLASGGEYTSLGTWVEDEISLCGITAYGGKGATHVIQEGDIISSIAIEPYGNYYQVFFEYADLYDN